MFSITKCRENIKHRFGNFSQVLVPERLHYLDLLNGFKGFTVKLTSLFAISGYSGKASGRFFGGFGGDFPVVFGLLPDENLGKKIP